MGEKGARILSDDGSTDVPCPSVEVVDTTGAGDAFNAGLAIALAQGSELVEAVRSPTAPAPLPAPRWASFRPWAPGMRSSSSIVKPTDPPGGTDEEGRHDVGRQARALGGVSRHPSQRGARDWPELLEAFAEHGVHNFHCFAFGYRIFAYLETEDDDVYEVLGRVAQTPVKQKWDAKVVPWLQPEAAEGSGVMFLDLESVFYSP